MIEIAPETAKRCQEKSEGRWGSIGRGVRRRRSQPFRRPSDVVHLPAYSACPVRTIVRAKGTSAILDVGASFARSLNARRSDVARDLKAFRLPSPSLTRIFQMENANSKSAHGLVRKVCNFSGPSAVSGQMASHHFDQIKRSWPQ